MTVVDASLEQRTTLLGVAYRLLGSWADAEDVVQEAWLRWSSAGAVVASDVVGERVRSIQVAANPATLQALS